MTLERINDYYCNDIAILNIGPQKLSHFNKYDKGACPSVSVGWVRFKFHGASGETFHFYITSHRISFKQQCRSRSRLPQSRGSSCVAIILFYLVTNFINALS